MQEKKGQLSKEGRKNGIWGDGKKKSFPNEMIGLRLGLIEKIGV